MPFGTFLVATVIAIIITFSLFLNVYLFWERESMGEQGRGREREREKPRQALCYQSGAQTGVPVNQEIMTWAEIKSLMLNWLSHPGATTVGIFKLLVDRLKKKNSYK